MRNSSSIMTGGRRPSGVHRRAMFEDRAKPVWVSLPFVAVAAVAVFLFGHFVSSRRGRQLGRDAKRGKTTDRRDQGLDSDTLGSRVANQPLNLADLRKLRAEAAEARSRKGTAGKSDASTAQPTPLGMVLAVTRKVDQLEKEAANFLKEAGTTTDEKLEKQKEQFRLLELLTQVQLEIDAIKVNETVRQERKVQTTRVQSLISALERYIPDMCDSTEDSMRTLKSE